EHVREGFQFLVRVVGQRLRAAHRHRTESQERGDHKDRQSYCPTIAFYYRHATPAIAESLNLSRTTVLMHRDLSPPNQLGFDSRSCVSGSLTSGRDQSKAPM